VSGLDGVDKAEVDFESKTVTITMKEGKTLTKEALDKAFEGSKFSVTKFETVEAKKEERKEEKKEGN
jgi:copper chaperone CopZ